MLRITFNENKIYDILLINLEYLFNTLKVVADTFLSNVTADFHSTEETFKRQYRVGNSDQHRR